MVIAHTSSGGRPLQEARRRAMREESPAPPPLPRPSSAGASILSDNSPVATEKTVRALALGLPETSEKPCYGTPAFYVKKKLFARLLPDPKVLAVRVDMNEREALLEVAPEVFFVTPHYQGWPMVLIRLPEIEKADLEERLLEAWHFAAPAKLRAQLDASHSRGERHGR
jgi:hypothetical protein